MALTLSYPSIDSLKGPFNNVPAGHAMGIMRVSVGVSGTYATGGDTVDLCQYLSPTQTAGAARKGAMSGATAIKVLWVQAFGDYYDGTNALTAETLTLSSGGTATPISAASTNNKVLVKLFTGTNGAGGSEVANGTALNGAYGLVFGVEITYGNAGVA